jgi:hypothetical protein
MDNLAFDLMLIPDYLDEPFRGDLRELALSNWRASNLRCQPCGKRGYFNLNDNYPDLSERADFHVHAIMARAGISKENYSTARHFIGVNIPTAFVTPHTDAIQFADTADLVEPVEVRFNSYLQRPEGGGVPIIGEQPVPIPPGCALAFNAALVHSTTPVEGSRIRVVCSVSAAVSKSACALLYSLGEKVVD